MKTMYRSMTTVAQIGSLALMLAVLGGVPQKLAASPLPGTCLGNCGTDNVDGVVTAGPVSGGSYQYVSTYLGVTGTFTIPGASPLAPVVPPGGGAGVGETNGSMLATSTFTAAQGSTLNYYFDYVTTDGGVYDDYAWAGLYDANTQSIVALLFTARTAQSGATVSGQGLPAPDAIVNNGNPVDIQIANNNPNTGGPDWSPLGSPSATPAGSSGSCFAVGCGYTGWVNSQYVIQTAGTYYIVASAVNFGDEAFDSGLAMDGQLLPPTGGNPSVPEPGTWAVAAAGVLALCLTRRKALV